VESKKHGETDFERRSIVVFQEDIDVFLPEFEKAVAYLRGRKPGV